MNAETDKDIPPRSGPGQPDAQAPDLAAILAASRGRGSRWRLWLVLLLLAAGAGFGVYAYYDRDQPAFTYAVQPVRQGDLSVLVTATGSLQPTDQVDISSELSGTVRKVNVTYNSPVKAGDVLAELDTNKLQADVQSARAKLASAKANVVKANAELGAARIKLSRLTALVDKNVSSQQDLDAAQSAYDSALATKDINESAVLSAEADLRLAEVNLSKARIISPIDGVVLTRDVEPGQTVASSFSAPVLFSIAGDLRRMELQVAVDEADVGQVEEGQSATFSVDAYPGRVFPARIETVRFASETVSNVVTYKAILSVDNADLLLRPGMTATADVTVQSVENALLVPNAALRFSPPLAERAAGGSILSRLFRPPRRPGAVRNRDQQSEQSGPVRRPIFLLENGQPRRVMIETGPTDGQFTVAISDEVKEGDNLITSATARSN